MYRSGVFLDSGQSLVEAAMLHGEALRVDAHPVEDRRVQVADVDGVFDDVVAEVVGLAVTDSALDPSAGHPH